MWGLELEQVFHVSHQSGPQARQLAYIEWLCIQLLLLLLLNGVSSAAASRHGRQSLTIVYFYSMYANPRGETADAVETKVADSVECIRPSIQLVSGTAVLRQSIEPLRIYWC